MFALLNESGKMKLCFHLGSLILGQLGQAFQYVYTSVIYPDSLNTTGVLVGNLLEAEQRRL